MLILNWSIQRKMLKQVQHDTKRGLLVDYCLTAVAIGFLPLVEMTRMEGKDGMEAENLEYTYKRTPFYREVSLS
jgi:hypothetical protein